jgi:TRAP-type mannitol/chloroaromatic compound transport system substrate-binding protein
MKRRQFLRAAGLAAAADASLKAAFELYAETSKTNADFKKVLDAMLAFRNDEYLW